MSQPIVLISVGNTRTRFATAQDAQIEPGAVLPNSDLPRIIDRLCELALSEAGPRQVFIASVNNPVADRIDHALRDRGLDPARFGKDLPVPIVTALEDDSTVGIDRLLDALGAFDRSKQACVVIDAGTAVTVDFVDGEGVFHGGAIAPGLHMMLKSLHQQTAALPDIAIDPALVPPATSPDLGEHPGEHQGPKPFGSNTSHAMTIGVVAAIRGMCHHLIDRYAEFYRGYPRVVATGGDAPLLFENDALVEHVVPDLVLAGMLAAVNRLRELDEHQHSLEG